MGTQGLDLTRDYGLTSREIQILSEAICSQSRKALANKLAISVRTVDYHILNLCTKLSASDYIQLLKIAQNKFGLALFAGSSDDRRLRVELTPTETEALAQFATGKNRAEVAEEMCISVRTVDFHVQNLYIKLGIDSRVQLLAAAKMRYGMELFEG